MLQRLSASLVKYKSKLAGAIETTLYDLLDGCINVKEFGAKGDGITDDTHAITSAAVAALDGGKKLVFDEGTYLFTQIYAASSTERIASSEWIARGKVNLVSTKQVPDKTNYDADYAIRVSGKYVKMVNMTRDAYKNNGVIYLSDANGVDVGDFLLLQTSRLIQTDHRGQAREGQLCKVNTVDRASGRVGLVNTLRYSPKANSVKAGSVTSASSGSSFNINLSLNRKNSNVRITFTSGANKGEFRYITGFNGGNVTIGGRQSAFPHTPAVGDTFNLEWVTTVGIVKPVKFKMTGDFTISRALTLNASAGDYGFRGLDIIYADTPYINISEVKGFSDTCIRMRGCFLPTLDSTVASDANRAYNEWDGTGYGVSVNQCFGAKVLNVDTFRCRRGIDVIGTQMISWDTIVDNCRSHGGGVGYTGVAFWPVGTMQNSGIGSHGAGYNTMYTNCTVTDAHLPYAIRGLNESIKDCKVYGYAYSSCVRLVYGGGLTVENLIYDDTFTEIGVNINESYVDSDRPGRRAIAVVRIFVGPNDGYLRTYPVVIKGCFAKKVTLAAVVFEGRSTTPIENIVIGDNLVYVSSEETHANEFSFIRSDNCSISNFTDLGGNRFILDGGTELNWSMYDLRVQNVESGKYVRLADNKVFATLDQNTAVAIPISTKTKMAMVSVFDHERDRDYRAVNMLLAAGRGVDYSPLAASNKYNVELSDQVLTGTTGSAGKFTVSMFPNGGAGKLYLENRLSETMRPIVVIETVPF